MNLSVNVNLRFEIHQFPSRIKRERCIIIQMKAYRWMNRLLNSLNLISETFHAYRMIWHDVCVWLTHYPEMKILFLWRLSLAYIHCLESEHLVAERDNKKANVEIIAGNENNSQALLLLHLLLYWTSEFGCHSRVFFHCIRSYDWLCKYFGWLMKTSSPQPMNHPAS